MDKGRVHQYSSTGIENNVTSKLKGGWGQPSDSNNHCPNYWCIFKFRFI